MVNAQERVHEHKKHVTLVYIPADIPGLAWPVLRFWLWGMNEVGVLMGQSGGEGRCVEKLQGLPCPQLNLAGAPRVVRLWPETEAFRLAAH